MRQIILDTETTGLEWKKGNRVVEIGCVELLERRPTGRTYHQYIHPQREFEQGAAEVTGLSLDFLSDKPLFAQIADEFLAFIDGAELIIHNAAFDVGFLDYELSLLGERYGRLQDRVTVEDSLLMARQRFPGQRNSLDALCKRLGVDNTHRQLHGALLDAQLLCDVYLALTSGQSEIGFGSLDEQGTAAAAAASVNHFSQSLPTGPRVRVQPSDEELAAHAGRLEKLRKKAGGSTLWDQMEAEAQLESAVA
ncbi:DNA polymerase III subunit epsilon [Pseudoxanthomonas indica]|uniref:DNA polymerase III subunit epsilon n=1 Tax=Pseudoxanthomonas indica TaxID=428993 RepID=A0A1T5LT77_9GAMM|nr:DNA polymerase III subunit epsilon [Pseudoxanthomonas indica]GGD39299.1 DNA polymerase III subunit epsilon [Pseudoxanthomonas indica]SKC79183.1 DNA polymerase III, epsilon subunit [Pseudoxanthomonas indica]